MIYAIKTLAGTYYNQRDKTFHSTSIYNASVTSNKLQADGILKKLKLKGHKGLLIYEITEDNFNLEMSHKTITAIIKAASLKRELEDIQYCVPMISAVNKRYANTLDNTIGVLNNFMPKYKELESMSEETLLETEGYYDEFMMLCGKVQVHETADLIRIIKAYKKDAKSINGLTKKILK